MTWYKEWFGEEYLELYSYRDEEEARRQVDFFRDHLLLKSGRILDLACGNGRHTAEFLERGYRAVGCDLSFTLLRAGAAENGSMSITCADMRRLPFCDRSFHALVSFFTSFGYFEDERENLLALREMSRVLQPSAPLLFDYLNVDRELKCLNQYETVESDLGTVKIERWFEPSSHTFNKRISIGERKFLERVRGYRLEELKDLFQRGGFAIRRVCGDFDGGPFVEDSPRLIILGEKVA
jgi:SAM-dependent methyltransferase